ncbi:hypothetical protein DSM104299_03671 [Baekduia alba]|uniref:hypothetical protein n=1 Tax=Baekduia alba TaxID=2997333 RepID=UPI00234255C1|nr:hypothetical protein [Baekduia alba]WCB94931.1 hypothetical protein DSM104299_03671 [Baekduia alba]
MTRPVPIPGGDPRGPTLSAAVQVTIGAVAAIVKALVGRAPAVAAPDATAAPRPARHTEALVYELLDAHADTAELAAELWGEPRWAAHLDYLQALQRTGRETLAEMARDRA